jgi:hypothetical protein
MLRDNQLGPDWRAFYRLVVSPYRARTTLVCCHGRTGLQMVCELDDRLYPKGVVISDKELATINIARADFHREWNCTIKPHRSYQAVDF